MPNYGLLAIDDRATILQPVSEVPYDIKEMIWKAALPEGRFVFLQHTDVLDTLPNTWFIHNRLPSLLYTHHLFSSTAMPAMLHACVESRRIMQAAGWGLELGKNGDGKVWFNFERDVLYYPMLKSESWHGFQALSFPDLLSETHTSKIKRAAVGLRREGRVLDGVEKFPKLEEFYVILDHGGRELTSESTEGPLVAEQIELGRRVTSAYRYSIRVTLGVEAQDRNQQIQLPWYRRKLSKIRGMVQKTLGKYRELKMHLARTGRANVSAQDELWTFIPAHEQELEH